MGISIMYIRKYGQGMNSPISQHRKLFIEIKPFPSAPLIEALNIVVSDLRNLKQLWDFDVSGLTTWYKIQPCTYCINRQMYEQAKFESVEYFWRRMYCWRHYLVEHLNELITDTYNFIENNRTVELQADKQMIILKLVTNNYNYSVTVNRSYATIKCIYKKNKKFTFMYNNHAKSFPLMSSYLRILSNIIDVLINFIDYLDWVIRYAPNPWTLPKYNLYINNQLIFNASATENT